MRSAAARAKIVVRTGGDERRVGASFLHRIGRLFTLTLKPRNGLLRTRTAKGGLGERLGLAPVGTPITP